VLGIKGVQVLNGFREKTDDGKTEHPLQTQQEFKVDPGDAQLHTGEHVAAGVHALALQECRQMLLRPVLFGAQPGNIPANRIPGRYAAAHFNLLNLHVPLGDRESPNGGAWKFFLLQMKRGDEDKDDGLIPE